MPPHQTPPIENKCTLKQACEYIALGWPPRTSENEDLCKPEQYMRSTNYAFLSHGNAFGSPIITPDNQRYNVEMSKALSKLYDLLRDGAVIAEGIPDPALPDWTENDIAFNSSIHKRLNYLPDEHTERVQVSLLDEWEIDVIYNWIITVPTQPCVQTSFRNVQIDFAALRAAYPIKQHTVIFTDDGCLCDDDGTTITTIHHLRKNTKIYEWLKFYIEHPGQIISRQELIDNFSGTRFQYHIESDRMDQCIHNAFATRPDLKAACFPIATTREVCFKPTFSDADIQPPHST